MIRKEWRQQEGTFCTGLQPTLKPRSSPFTEQSLHCSRWQAAFGHWLITPPWSRRQGGCNSWQLMK